MEKGEFIKKAKEFGYSDAVIDEIIKRHDKAAEDGITLPYETELVELPIND